MSGPRAAGGPDPTPALDPDPDPDPALRIAADAGIHRIELPTPFRVGSVNVYLIEDEPLTIVDVGPNFGSALDGLARALDARGHRLEDLELIVITHQHIDHLGLLEVLARRSGAEIAAFAELVDYFADFPAAARADDDFAIEVMLRHGVPADVARALGEVAGSFRQFGSGAPLTRPLHDGDTIALRDRTLQVAHRPGHSPSDLVFADAERRILFGGDHLLARISSNPVIARPLSGPALDVAAGERPHALVSYIESMRATREMSVDIVLGGHGAPVAGRPAALVDERMRMHDRRRRKLAELLAAGPQTAYELSQRMWGNVAVTQAFLTLSEVLGHLDLLIADGLVAEDLDGPVTRFSLVAGRP